MEHVAGRRSKQSKTLSEGSKDALKRKKTLLEGSQDGLKRKKTLLEGSQDGLKRKKTLLEGFKDVLKRKKTLLKGSQDVLKRAFALLGALRAGAPLPALLFYWAGPAKKQLWSPPALGCALFLGRLGLLDGTAGQIFSGSGGLGWV